MRLLLTVAALQLALVAFMAQSPTEGQPVSFVKEVQPLINVLCVSCHAGGRPAAGLSLETYAGLALGNRKAKGLVPGKPNDSLIYMTLNEIGGVKKMPPRRIAQPTAKEIELIQRWIEQGAKDDTPPKPDK